MPSALAPTDHASSPFVAASAAFLSSNHGETLSPGVPRERHYYPNSTKQTLSQTYPLGGGRGKRKNRPQAASGRIPDLPINWKMLSNRNL
jgi:hypothetical protein